MVLDRAKNISLQRAGHAFKTGRSFHLGNLTIRDMVPLVAGCEGEVFDLNLMSDTAYFPQKLVFQERICDLLLDDKSSYVATSRLQAPPKITTHKPVAQLVEKAYEESKTLGGFWMRINEELGIGQFKTFSQKLQHNRDLVAKVLTKVTNALSPEELSALWARYVYRDSLGQEHLLRLSDYSREREYFIYSDGLHTVKVDKSEIVEACLDFFKHWSSLSEKQVDLQVSLPQCQ